ncbi:hypothetical protein M2272_001522 [Mycobacterium frederiksbergense]|uniref:MarR family transcriptional regulator n=1 Tax=Mycolicibacterium frederiksbergense TaxID=117567 RepID=A0ABT6KVZ9_9MYCO|nr:hypothetical protein [Mycolicibacterium frederiksbergense]MDH6194893.1 hypothetical protein [Mycolicibacterium frederiksbergense]
MNGQTLDPEALRWVVDDLAYHQARVLLLVAAVAEEPGHSRKLDGLTKLAKLDFLVRYPALAGVVLDDLAVSDHRMHISSDEISAPTEAEDPMIRYRYGPWDDRYYPVVGALVSRGLLRYLKGRNGSVALTATAAGKKLAKSLIEEPVWRDVAERCQAIAQASVGLSGNALKERIYDRLADLMDRPHRQVIS